MDRDPPHLKRPAALGLLSKLCASSLLNAYFLVFFFFIIKVATCFDIYTTAKCSSVNIECKTRMSEKKSSGEKATGLLAKPVM